MQGRSDLEELEGALNSIREIIHLRENATIYKNKVRLLTPNCENVKCDEGSIETIVFDEDECCSPTFNYI
jgi:hypothetical protein